MSLPITAFIPYSGNGFTQATVDQLRNSSLIGKINLLATDDSLQPLEGCKLVKTGSLLGSETFRLMAKKNESRYILLIIHDTAFEFGQFALERFLAVAENTGSGLVYSDYYDLKEGKRA
ncbi:MAG: glycosyltransferase family 2 protein, partial [Bacteroidota bacterium]